MLPSAHDICPIPEDLDGKVALEHYLGRSLAEAEAQIGGHSLYYLADFMWMGPVAFRFYLPAVHAYFTSEKSNEDVTGADWMIGILEERLRREREEMLPARPAIMALLGTLIERSPAFAVSDEIWGDLRAKAGKLRERYANEAEA